MENTMKSRAIHRCLHVLDLDTSLAFYKQALGMTEIRRMGPDDGSWLNVFIGNESCGFQLELTWNRGRTEPYHNGGRDAGAAMLTEANAAIIVLGNPDVADTWIEDCSIVMANMHLEASASGVASCWIQGRMRYSSDGRSTQDFVADLLDIPEPWKLEAMLSLGMPKVPFEPREFDDKLLTKVHQESF